MTRISKSRILAVFASCALALLLAACGGQAQSSSTTEASSTAGSQATTEASTSTTDDTAKADYQKPGDDYKLEQVVVLSRHNIRAPLSTNGSALAKATPHQWINWTADSSELTLRGGALETMMGQYFRQWFEEEGLASHNWRPEDGQVRFYANGKQRTIATAQYFSSGMLPTANATIEVHAEFDKMDPVFNPQITFLTDSYNDAALAQIAQMGGDTGMEGVAAKLKDNYALLTDVVDYTNSEGYKSGELTDLSTTDTGVKLEVNKEPAMTGSLKTANSLVDALVLQYYEAGDDKRAAFGHDLTLDQWTSLSAIKDTYGDVLFTAPLVAVNVAHPLLAEIGSELDTNGRLFTFLCGHDSNIGSVLAALQAENYELPNTIEKKTPIGSKLVFEKWTNSNGEQFGRVRLMYQNTDQLKNLTLLTGGEAPETMELTLTGLSKNADGLYNYNDLRSRIQEATDAYDDLAKTYGDQQLAEAA